MTKVVLIFIGSGAGGVLRYVVAGWSQRLANGSFPIVIEIVDSESKINTLMPFIDQAVQEGLVTLERVRVIKYRANGHDT